MMEAMEMEVGVSSAPAPWGLLYGVAALLVLGALYRAAERCWLGPRRVAGALQAQGLRGTAYRFPAGDLPENARRSKEARAKPMPRCHNIVPRVAPLLHGAVKEYAHVAGFLDLLQRDDRPLGQQTSWL